MFEMRASLPSAKRLAFCYKVACKSSGSLRNRENGILEEWQGSQLL